jgi:predicted transcriptional regulator
MSATKKAGDMAQEGFAAEDIATMLQTTPAVVRTLLHRTKSGGKTLNLRLPDHLMSELEKKGASYQQPLTAKSIAQILLIRTLRQQNLEENNESHT